MQTHSDDLRFSLPWWKTVVLRAAAVLETDNSAVSRSVKRLEAKLGVTLLNRTTRQISTTEEGAQYFRRAKRFWKTWHRRKRKSARQAVCRRVCCVSMPPPRWC